MAPMKILLMALAVLSLASCAGAPSSVAKDAAPAKDLVIAVGPYMVSPPPAKWRMTPGALGATLIHEDSNQAHTMAIRMLPVIPPDEMREPSRFEEAVRNYNEDRFDPERQRIVHASYVPVVVNGLSCMAYQVEGADLAQVNGASVPFVIIGQLCRHPWHPDWVDVSFAERGGSGGVSQMVREAGSKVLASLRMVPK